MAATRTDTNRLAISDPAEKLTWYDLEYARYGFCGDCGSSLFYQAADRPHITSIMVGTLDDATELRLQGIWFAAEAQPHNQLSDAVPHFEGNA